MCTGLEVILPLLSAGLSAAGGMITAKEQQRQVERQAEARNKELNRTLIKNDALAEDSRSTFRNRIAQSDPNQNAKDQKAAEKERAGDQTQAIDAATQGATENVPLSGAAPTVVKTELAKRIGDALDVSKSQAKAQAKLGSYGDTWLNQGFQDQNAGRNLAVSTDFANGNMALLPYAQDFAEVKATKPISPLGGLLQGFGSMMGSFGGASGGSALPKKQYTSPWIG